ncbi:MULTISPECIES: hypothetical protein [Salmonella]|uniref:Uncharacterized protein n=1 Tax=Salmonella enteritidis TaxID=149539 RepID=A0A624ALT7_SALEN|nr:MULTISPECIES: hypothetical protein [Salmonella]HDW6424191.1 hypothetical protein [Salmonella enterica subsp. enterica serovar Typhi]ECI2920361.1 hypothetical protein [Salmonella enterica subsp. enterica serovar Enteritidis]ECZ5195158.1 hypothetical protein [Salmonella enterica subsp. enterica serovar Enteritidis]EDM8340718.1 hypothetical protein [Salmonella enterica subsp. enterica serovar Enteritidis]EDT1755281.1 hypothetical protein [Salmonella enterica subsp. enterica serovar Enteritidis
MNKHTLTRISEEAFNELTRIKRATSLSHRTIMQLAIAKEVTESDLLKYPVSKGRKHIRITQDALDTLKALNGFKIDIARLLSIKIHKLSQEV